LHFPEDLASLVNFRVNPETFPIAQGTWLPGIGTAHGGSFSPGCGACTRVGASPRDCVLISRILGSDSGRGAKMLTGTLCTSRKTGGRGAVLPQRVRLQTAFPRSSRGTRAAFSLAGLRRRGSASSALLRGVPRGRRRNDCWPNQIQGAVAFPFRFPPPGMGLNMTEPQVISLLEQGKEPWVVGRELTRGLCSAVTVPLRRALYCSGRGGNE
ncbi:hypothetical protein MC885_004510, partial [Smutsia gigantea]